jgi:hypothetical protein
MTESVQALAPAQSSAQEPLIPTAEMLAAAEELVGLAGQQQYVPAEPPAGLATQSAMLSVPLPAPPPSPFTLTPDREFTAPLAPLTPADRLTAALAAPGDAALTALATPAAASPAPSPSLAIPPAAPGTPSSPYRRCPCIGVMPGRACPHCLSTKWLRTCSTCLGTGRLDASTTRGVQRSQPCIRCRNGQVSAGLKEVAEAQGAYFAWEEAVRSGLAPAPAPAAPAASPSAVPRAPRFPGIGAVERKRPNEPKQRARRTARKRAAVKSAGLPSSLPAPAPRPSPPRTT